MGFEQKSKKTIGFVASTKENEQRRALLPEDIKNIKEREFLYFEKGYGEVLNISDAEYTSLGCHVATREEVMEKDIICDPKIGDADYIENLKQQQIIFGWVHAVQNEKLTDILVEKKITAYAWEDMEEKGRHSFWRNNEIAGEAAVLHSFQYYGGMPYNAKVAVLGRGNVANGAVKMLNKMGAQVTIYNRKSEKLFQDELHAYDIVVNCILWDIARKDHIIYKKDIKKMREGNMIVDVSCDHSGAIETSVPTTIENPVYTIDGIVHYVVDHTPAIYYRTASLEVSCVIAKYVDDLVNNIENTVLNNAKIISNGIILDEKIKIVQDRK